MSELHQSKARFSLTLEHRVDNFYHWLVATHYIDVRLLQEVLKFTGLSYITFYKLSADSFI